MKKEFNSDLILEMFGRIKTLEKEVEILKEVITGKKNSLKENSKKITRKKARDIVINKLKKDNPKLEFKVATRSAGSGIQFSYKDKINPNISYPIYGKFYFSNVTGKEEGDSWFSVRKEDIEEILNSRKRLEEGKDNLNNKDLLIFFSINEDTNEELIVIIPGINVSIFINEKGVDTYDSNNMYHFYFRKTDDGRVVEYRDEKIDVTNFANKYYLLTDYYIDRNTYEISKYEQKI